MIYCKFLASNSFSFVDLISEWSCSKPLIFFVHWERKIKTDYKFFHCQNTIEWDKYNIIWAFFFLFFEKFYDCLFCDLITKTSHWMINQWTLTLPTESILNENLLWGRIILHGKQQTHEIPLLWHVMIVMSNNSDYLDNIFIFLLKERLSNAVNFMFVGNFSLQSDKGRKRNWELKIFNYKCKEIFKGFSIHWEIETAHCAHPWTWRETKTWN